MKKPDIEGVIFGGVGAVVFTFVLIGMVALIAEGRPPVGAVIAFVGIGIWILTLIVVYAWTAIRCATGKGP